MADITLAEVQGNVWLVGGEPYIDDLLANTLAPNVSIEIIPCERKSEVKALWVQLSGPDVPAGDPWLIHPAIVARIRRTSPGYSLFFAEWSAMIDKDAQNVIASVAAWAEQNADGSVELVEFVDPTGPAAVSDLSRLRAQLVEDHLKSRGVAPGRITRVRRGIEELAGVSQESQRIDINVKAAA
jgi:hypothetical protein